MDNPGLCVCCSQNNNNVKNAYIINQAGSYCSLTPLCSGMGEVVPARTSLTLSPRPLTLCCNYCFKVTQCSNCRD